MQSLTTYAEWINLLNQFGEGNDESLEQLNKGTFIIDAGTASRFYAVVENTYKKRKQKWLNKLQQSFRMQEPKTIADFEIVLRNGKQNLNPLIIFITLKGIPDDLKKTLKNDLEAFVEEIKKSLQDGVSKSAGGSEKMMILLNSFGINSKSEKIETTDSGTTEILPVTGRKIIF